MTSTRPWKYSVHPGVQMAQNSVATLEQKTGRTLEQWISLLNESGPAVEKERVAWLKERHGLGTNYAGWITERSYGRGLETSDPAAYLAAAERWVEEMYSGPKSVLRPLYDRLLELAFKLGNDVRVSPGKTIVPIYRHHVIAQIKPATRTRIDFGLALGDAKATTRMKDTGGFAKGDRITHTFGITSLDEIDAQIQKSLERAYERDGE
jgi:hypothetical protein